MLHIYQIHCGRTSQLTSEDASPKLTRSQIRDMQSIAGLTLYYARLINSTIIVIVNDYSQQQANVTEKKRHQNSNALPISINIS